MENQKIKITKNGPYLVSGGISLGELIIKPGQDGLEYVEGRVFPEKDVYALCRCGKSSTMPFCDGIHKVINFDGELTASKELFSNQAERYYGEHLILEDAEELCAFARFCHSKRGDVWTLTEEAIDKKDKALAIKMACECPAGRLVMIDKKTYTEIEPTFEPSIMLLQDPLQKCSGPLWVRGGIIIEDDKGYIYETRNRVTLCRCGESNNKPFCDANHINYKFNDKLNKKV